MYARVATFEGGDADAIRASTAEINERAAEGPPPGVDAKGVLLLVDPDGGRWTSIVLFETMEALRAGDAVLGEMSPGDAAGSRTSVDVYEVGANLTLD